VLRAILEVNKEFENLVIQTKIFVKIASDGKEYEKDSIPTE
jgi:hypothetical protein